jgi:hypothetical protein
MMQRMTRLSGAAMSMALAIRVSASQGIKVVLINTFYNPGSSLS